MLVNSSDSKRVWVTLMAAALVSTVACSKAASVDSAAPMAEDAEAPRGEGRQGDPLGELAALEGQMRALGLEPSPAGSRDGAEEQQDLGGDYAGGAEASPPTDATGLVAEEEMDGEEMDGEAAPVPSAPAPAPDESNLVEIESTSVGGSRKKSAGRREQKLRERDHCEAVCGLTDSICELEVRICSLSEVHGDELTYANACERAIDDCEVAGYACDECG